MSDTTKKQVNSGRFIAAAINNCHFKQYLAVIFVTASIYRVLRRFYPPLNSILRMFYKVNCMYLAKLITIYILQLDRYNGPVLTKNLDSSGNDNQVCQLTQL